MFDFNRLYLEADFAEKADAENWLYMAAALRHAAERIDWKKKNDFMDWIFVPIYRMLIAFSVENLLKGIQIIEGNEALEESELSKQLSSHGLRWYADKVSGIEITEDEKKILDELEQYIRWAGRYPIPKKAVQLIRRVHSEELHAAELALGQKLADYLSEQINALRGEEYLAAVARGDVNVQATEEDESTGIWY